MPRGDGTGPQGKGPMTGRGMGKCNQIGNTPISGRGRGLGMGRGLGRGGLNNRGGRRRGT